MSPGVLADEVEEFGSECGCRRHFDRKGMRYRDQQECDECKDGDEGGDAKLEWDSGRAFVCEEDTHQQEWRSQILQHISTSAHHRIVEDFDGRRTERSISTSKHPRSRSPFRSSHPFTEKRP